MYNGRWLPPLVMDTVVVSHSSSSSHPYILADKYDDAKIALLRGSVTSQLTPAPLACLTPARFGTAPRSCSLNPPISTHHLSLYFEIFLCIYYRGGVVRVVAGS